MSQIWDDHFVERLILRLSAFFFIPFHLKPVHSKSLQNFATFWPKMAEHHVTKHHFLKHFSADSVENFSRRRQIDTGYGTDLFFVDF